MEVEIAWNKALLACSFHQKHGSMKLGRSYKLGRRLTPFSNERRSHTMVGIGERGYVSPDSLAAAGADGYELSESGNTEDHPRHHGNGLITIVDDDEYGRAGLKRLLESLGRRVVTFVSAEEFLASDNKAYTACLILDVHLPGMSGPDLQARLLAEGECPPTVFVSGRCEEHVEKRVTEAGALGYLTKPYCMEELLNCIEKVRCKLA